MGRWNRKVFWSGVNDPKGVFLGGKKTYVSLALPWIPTYKFTCIIFQTPGEQLDHNSKRNQEHRF